MDILVPYYLPGKCKQKLDKEELHGLEVTRLGFPYAIWEKAFYAAPHKASLHPLNLKKYDVVEVHLCGAPFTTLLLEECKRQRVKIIQRCHVTNLWKETCPVKGLKNRIRDRQSKYKNERLLHKMDAIIGVSNLVCDIVKEKIHDVPVYMVHNGVKTDLFLGTARKENAVFTVLCVANLIEQKGQEYLIRAVAKEIHKGRDIRLQLIGVGVDREKLERLCQELQIADKTHFLGAQLYETVAEYMGRADMFIMPSYGEAFACVCLEAMSSGTVTCGCCEESGIVDFVTNGVNGILVHKKNSDEIAEAIEYVMDNPKEAKAMAAAGRKTAQEFTWEASARSLVSVYEKVIGC